MLPMKKEKTIEEKIIAVLKKVKPYALSMVQIKIRVCEPYKKSEDKKIAAERAVEALYDEGKIKRKNGEENSGFVYYVE